MIGHQMDMLEHWDSFQTVQQFCMRMDIHGNIAENSFFNWNYDNLIYLVIPVAVAKHFNAIFIAALPVIWLTSSPVDISKSRSIRPAKTTFSLAQTNPHSTIAQFCVRVELLILLILTLKDLILDFLWTFKGLKLTRRVNGSKITTALFAIISCVLPILLIFVFHSKDSNAMNTNL